MRRVGGGGTNGFAGRKCSRWMIDEMGWIEKPRICCVDAIY